MKQDIDLIFARNLAPALHKAEQEISEAIKAADKEFIQSVIELVLANLALVNSLYDKTGSADDANKAVDEMKRKSIAVSDRLRILKGVPEKLWS